LKSILVQFSIALLKLIHTFLWSVSIGFFQLVNSSNLSAKITLIKWVSTSGHKYVEIDILRHLATEAILTQVIILPIRIKSDTVNYEFHLLVQ